MPQTSVLLTTYNCAKFIGQAIDSILQQSYKDFEIIVIDDGSTDNTDQIINSYSNVRYYKNESNMGISASLNRGIDFATGKYIARMDADDIILGNRLEDQINFLEKNKEYGMVGGWYKVMDEEGRFKQNVKPYVKNEDVKLALLFRNQFAQPTITGHTRLFQELRYDVNYSCAEDHDLWIRFSEVSKIANLPSYYLSYRWHKNSTCSSRQRELKICVLNLLSRELDKLGLIHDQEELMLHAAVCFGMGPLFFKDKIKRRQLLDWFDKIFDSSILKERYEKQWLSSFKREILKNYCGVS